MQRVRAYADRAKIRSVKILVSGVLITTMAFSSFLSAFAASDKYTMGYLYHGTEEQQIQSVNQTNGALDTVSPSYFDIQEDGSLKQNNISSSFVDTMHQQGIKAVSYTHLDVYKRQHHRCCEWCCPAAGGPPGCNSG